MHSISVPQRSISQCFEHAGFRPRMSNEGSHWNATLSHLSSFVAVNSIYASSAHSSLLFHSVVTLNAITCSKRTLTGPSD